MKMPRFFSTIFILSALMVLGAVSASAQGGIAPSSQLGIGAGTFGAQIQYAISAGFHLGSGFGLVSESPSVGDSRTTITIEPYARFLFEGTVNPFLQAGISIRSASSTTNTDLVVTGGLEYFITRNVGIWGMIGILDIPFEDGATKVFGITQRGGAGVEWYFNP